MHAIDTPMPGEHPRLLADYLTVDQLAHELDKDIRTLRRWRVRRLGPPCKRVGGRLLYKRQEVLAWIDSQVAA